MTIEPTALKDKAAAQPAMKLAVTSAKAPQFVKGRRDFFKYRDHGVTKATDGWMRATPCSFHGACFIKRTAPRTTSKSSKCRCPRIWGRFQSIRRQDGRTAGN